MLRPKLILKLKRRTHRRAWLVAYICLPHLSINSCLEHIAIAKPYKKKEIEEEEGFWEIKEKQTELNKNESQGGPPKLKKQRVWITPNVVIN